MFMGICKGRYVYIYIYTYLIIYIYVLLMNIQYVLYIYIFYQILSVNVISDTIMGKNGIRKKNIISHNGDDSSLDFYGTLIF